MQRELQVLELLALLVREIYWYLVYMRLRRVRACMHIHVCTNTHEYTYTTYLLYGQVGGVKSAGMLVDAPMLGWSGGTFVCVCVRACACACACVCVCVRVDSLFHSACVHALACGQRATLLLFHITYADVC
jgi:hypothetical protein